jgi:hypothetical protein
MWETLRRWLGGWTPPAEETPPFAEGLPQYPNTEGEVIPKIIRPSADMFTIIIALLNGRPIDFEVASNLTISGLNLASLPDNLRVAGILEARGCPHFKQLGANTIIGRDLIIGGRYWSAPEWEKLLARTSYASWAIAGNSQNCPIGTLPAGLVVKRDLHVSHCPALRTIASNLKVAGNITIHSCRRLEVFPVTEVFGNLTINGAPGLHVLPKDLHVHGSLTLNGVGLRELPPGLVVGKNLQVGHLSKLERWPDKLDVGGKLTVVRTSMAAMPQLKVGWNIKLIKVDKLKVLPPLQCSRSLGVEECSDLERVEDGLNVAGSLSLLRCPKLVTLPRQLRVPETLNLSGCCALEHLPTQLDLGYQLQRPETQPCLVLNGTKVQSVPNNSKLNGLIDVTNSALTTLPSSYKGSRVLFRRVAVPRDYFFDPQNLSAATILAEPNAELRRIALEVLGIERVLQAANVKVLHEDTDAGGPRRLLQLRTQAETLRFLQCRCPSTNREYLLRVSPHVSTCHGAAAWMAGLDQLDYQPRRET